MLFNEKNNEILISELYCQYGYENSNLNFNKDIIIIVHNQLDYFKKCIDSIYENTNNFNIFVWDNNSNKEMKDFLEKLKERENVFVRNFSKNIGFIKPNNSLVALGKSPYIVLLNSDTEVKKGWDTAMIGWMLENPEYKQVGYLGGLLDEKGLGGKSLNGDEIDYVCGWCFCMERELYNKIGLFDEKNLNFAYCEDADLSLRIKKRKFKIRALHLDYVIHYGNKTIAEVSKKKDCSVTFKSNHEHMRKKWKKYLKEERVLVKNPEIWKDMPPMQ